MKIPDYFAKERMEVSRLGHVPLPRAPAGLLAYTGRSEAVEEAQALGGLGGALMQTGDILAKWYEREGNTQFDTQRRLAREAINRFELTGYPDADSHDTGYKMLRAEIKKLSPKNTTGAAKFQSWLDDKSPNLDMMSAEKKIRMIHRNNLKAYFRNISSIADEKDFNKARSEALLLTQGAIDDGTRTPAQATSDYTKIMDNWLLADVWRKATAIVRPDGEVDWSEAVKWFGRAENIKGIDPAIIDSLSEDARTQLTQQQRRDNEKIEAAQSEANKQLSDLLGDNKLTTIEIKSRREILDDADYKNWMKIAITPSGKKGNPIDAAELYGDAIDIWRGAISKTEFDKRARASLARPDSINETEYRSLMQVAEQKLKEAQAQALSRANQEAGRLIVDLKDDEETLKALLAVLKGKKRQEFMDKRKLQFWFLSQYNRELRDWIMENPDKIGKDFYQYAERLKHEYWNTSIEEIERLKNIGEFSYLPESEIMGPPEPMAYKYTAINPKTGERIGSNDGKKWETIP